MRVLALESSCDETAAAIVDDQRHIHANVILSQLDLTAAWGGVVPELSARAHLDTIATCIEQAFAQAQLGIDDIDGIAATAGPGLMGGLIVGLMAAKGLAQRHNKPFLAINHLEGHALTQRLVDDQAFPYLLLLVSGGHCQLLFVTKVGAYQRLGTTIDDAAGEAFDKVAKMMGLAMPGGPALERLAQQGDASAITLPSPMRGKPHCDFSFSGLKTAVRRQLELLQESQNCADFSAIALQDKANLAASFQAAVALALQDRCARAIALLQDQGKPPFDLVVAGGVAANKTIGAALSALCEQKGIACKLAPLNLCTDNAAMIAWAAIERFRLGQSSALDVMPKPRWPLDAHAEPSRFAGLKKA